MNIQTSTFTLLLLLTCAPLNAQQIYKYVDPQGKVTYSSEPIKGGKKVELPPISTISLPKPTEAKVEPKPAPIIDKAQRKKDLQDAIANEEKAIASAKTKAQASEVTTHEKKLLELKTELSHLDDKP